MVGGPSPSACIWPGEHWPPPCGRARLDWFPCRRCSRRTSSRRPRSCAYCTWCHAVWILPGTRVLVEVRVERARRVERGRVDDREVGVVQRVPRVVELFAVVRARRRASDGEHAGDKVTATHEAALHIARRTRRAAGQFPSVWRRSRSCWPGNGPTPSSSSTTQTPYQLLVATILSAQSTDKMINTVTPALFAKYPDAAALAGADQGQLEKQIHSTGFFRNKAKSLLGMARARRRAPRRRDPATMEELVELPGVARKTANVVLGEGMGINAGIVVDTHVTRLAGAARAVQRDRPGEDRAGPDGAGPARAVDRVRPAPDLARPPRVFREEPGLRALPARAGVPERVQGRPARGEAEASRRPSRGEAESRPKAKR